MTNIDRAARTVWEASRGAGEPLSAIASDYIAAALADAGLLMPELPEPQLVPTGMEDRVYLSWRSDPVDVEQSARITELFTPGESFPILSLDADESRCLGLRLLAAANHAERNQA